MPKRCPHGMHHGWPEHGIACAPCRVVELEAERDALRTAIYRQHMRLVQVAGSAPDALTREVLAEVKDLIDNWPSPVRAFG